MSDYLGKELKEAVWNNRPDLIKLCVENGADVNLVAPGCMGRSQLFVAIIHNKLNAAECLLELGADPNFADDSGKTAVEFVKGPEQEKIVRLLKSYGAE